MPREGLLGKLLARKSLVVEDHGHELLFTRHRGRIQPFKQLASERRRARAFRRVTRAIHQHQAIHFFGMRQREIQGHPAAHGVAHQRGLGDAQLLAKRIQEIDRVATR